MNIEEIREALTISPDNAVLRKMLAEALYDDQQFDAAEREYRHLMQQRPDHVEIMLGLARVFHAQGKLKPALVLLEQMMERPQPLPAARALYVKLLVAESRVQDAIQQYRILVRQEPALRDEDFEETYGIDATIEAAVVDGKVRQAEDAESFIPESILERPAISFEDVGGMQKMKEDIRMKAILPIQNPDLFKAYGKAAGGGLLLYGPPGCGKTYIARATAGEVDAAFISIGINDVLDMWIGNSEKNLHALFEKARLNRPCVLFFDEVDALGASRQDMRQAGGRHLINQFLAELDGINSNNDGLLILAATNAPWHLDNAFRRPGRFDQILFVPPPDQPARVEILKVQLKGKPVEPLDYEAVAKKTDGFSGADLKAVIDRAIEFKLKEAVKTGKVSPLVTKDLIQAAKETRPSTREWFASARNYALYANESGLYDDILHFLKER